MFARSLGDANFLLYFGISMNLITVCNWEKKSDKDSQGYRKSWLNQGKCLKSLLMMAGTCSGLEKVPKLFQYRYRGCISF